MEGWRERKREREIARYLTDNVIIVSQSTSMREDRGGVAQFPYVWVGALSDGREREIIIVSILAPPTHSAYSTPPIHSAYSSILAPPTYSAYSSILATPTYSAYSSILAPPTH
uniref:Uncharacterized protein n=1 Tax=Astyanax mexicanus TaxID=7994 RepID=A0A8B9H5J4_ASTMX